ncbi:hypothetical protein L917_02713 [Phytophthora nicotianae]|uniref:Uncharacterized protein n=1 Tax=Phytophthora nicotianae TaxID=4792 RepID=W2LVB3_PHYNI|nr:hypothetical protein L917_02713 [Phytophthora nicotianae]ETM53769.1 hypothetical protein L914_02783 [Phytophthora nicotianae]
MLKVLDHQHEQGRILRQWTDTYHGRSPPAFQSNDPLRIGLAQHIPGDTTCRHQHVTSVTPCEEISTLDDDDAVKRP